MCNNCHEDESCENCVESFDKVTYIENCVLASVKKKKNGKYINYNWTCSHALMYLFSY